MIPQTMEQLQDSEELCGYCADTDYGEHASYGTPNGQVFCEGAYCESAYERYLEEIGATDTIIKIKIRTKVTIVED